MPEPPTMKEYRLRVDGENDDLLINFMKTYTNRFLLVHHVTTTENPHYHAYVECKYTQGNFSNYVKKALTVKGSDYSNKICKPDRRHEYLSYLFNTKKGNKPRLVSYEGFSPIDVETYRHQANTIAEEWAKRASKDKKTQYDIAQIVLERIGRTYDRDWIYHHVIEVLKESKMMMRPMHVRDIVATVIMLGDNETLQTQLRKTVLKYFDGY
jgi:hypothetical protein